MPTPAVPSCFWSPALWMTDMDNYTSAEIALICAAAILSLLTVALPLLV